MMPKIEIPRMIFCVILFIGTYIKIKYKIAKKRIKYTREGKTKI